MTLESIRRAICSRARACVAVWSRVRPELSKAQIQAPLSPLSLYCALISPILPSLTQSASFFIAI
jgi:hypothetical protein